MERASLEDYCPVGQEYRLATCRWCGAATEQTAKSWADGGFVRRVAREKLSRGRG